MVGTKPSLGGLVQGCALNRAMVYSGVSALYFEFLSSIIVMKSYMVYSRPNLTYPNPDYPNLTYRNPRLSKLPNE